MHNFWLVAKHEYRRMVMRRGFIIVTLAIPLGFALLIAVVIAVETSGDSKLPVGYVDHAGFLDESLQADLPDPEDRIEIRAFANEEKAIDALENEEIQVVFVFPSEYPESLKTELYYLEDRPSGDVWREFDDFVRVNLLQELPKDVQVRLFEGPNIIVHDIASNREFRENAIINVILPMITSLIFFFATMSAAGYLLGVVATEKENRTMEIMLTSVTPVQLIGGKAVGLLSASLTQLAIYVIAAVIGLKIATPYVEFLQVLTMPWTYLGVLILFFFPAYCLVASIMVAIGGAVTELQQAQQVAGMINMFFMAPFFLIGVLFTNPDHPLIVFLTIFPTTSFLTISLRWGLGTVPVWQLGLAWGLMAATTILMIWVASRVFRAGMLQYGQPLRFRAVVTALRNQ